VLIYHQAISAPDHESMASAIETAVEGNGGPAQWRDR
jgi:hypothetical protein